MKLRCERDVLVEALGTATGGDGASGGAQGFDEGVALATELHTGPLLFS